MSENRAKLKRESNNSRDTQKGENLYPLNHVRDEKGGNGSRISDPVWVASPAHESRTTRWPATYSRDKETLDGLCRRARERQRETSGVHSAGRREGKRDQFLLGSPLRFVRNRIRIRPSLRSVLR